MPHSEYVIDAWSSAGARLATFTRRGLFEPPPEDGSDLPLGERPPHPYVPAIHADGEGRLRVISWLPRQDWRDGLEEVRMPDGTISLSPRDRDPASVQRAVIEIIDLGSRSVVAQIEAPALVQGFLGDDMVYATIHEPSGEVKMAVWSFTLTLPP